ncbi:hypothetical protein ES705_43039 [subsurface metagenome]
MISTFMRGFNKMLIDLIVNEKYANYLIGSIAEFVLEFHRKNLRVIGDKMDLFGIWDDFATQRGLMISADTWRKFYKPWHRKIVELAKSYDLFVVFHI